MQLLRLLLVLALAAGCGSEPPRTAAVDGGSEGVALLGEHVVRGVPGQPVTIRHVGSGPRGAPALQHAFVTPTGDGLLPPLFVGAAGTVRRNPAVWRECRAGVPDAGRRVCDGAPADMWDGQRYWSTGALAAGEEAHVPLAPGIGEGDHPLVCALHPGLRVLVRVRAAVPDPSERDQARRVDDALTFALSEDPHRPPTQVTAGIDAAGEAYVARFSPPRITVRRGATVTWRAGARAPVDVVFDGTGRGDRSGWDGRGELSSPVLSADPLSGAAGSTWSVRFTRRGAYRYRSTFAPTFRGTVVVE